MELRTAPSGASANAVRSRYKSHTVARRYGADASLLVAASVLRLLPTPGPLAAYALLGAYALSGRSRAILALMITWLLTMVSPGLAASPAPMVGRYLVMAAAMLSIMLRSFRRGGRLLVRRPVLATVLLGLFMCVHSLFVSPSLSVSLLKAISWTIVAATAIAAWSKLDSKEADLLQTRVHGILVAVMVVSLPLLVLPVGYLRNGSGFQGILNHPQPFGLTMALLAAWSGAKMFSQTRPSWSAVSVTGVSILLVFLSESRTAGLGMLLGLGLAVVAASPLSRRPMRQTLPGLWSRRVHGLVSVILVLSLLAWPVIGGQMAAFLGKRSGARTVAEAYDLSRGFLIDAMVSNVQDHPVAGIGFGVASDPTLMRVEYDELLGLPVSASVEKGVMPLAVLEELGLPGLILVSLWLMMVVRRAAANGVEELAVAATALGVNLGESVLFSPGGMGLLVLVLLGWSVRSSSAPKGV